MIPLVDFFIADLNKKRDLIKLQFILFYFL